MSLKELHRRSQRLVAPGLQDKIQARLDAAEEAKVEVRWHGPAVVVRRVKGDEALACTIMEMEAVGYEVANQATRKAVYSLAAGLFTRKQVHTVTFRRAG